LLNPQVGDCFADLTAGYGGHSEMLLSKVGSNGYGYLFDKDPDAIKALKAKFSNVTNVSIKHADFNNLNWENDIPAVEIMLADIGVSSPQIDQSSRGFSFEAEGPLDMRMDTTQEITAEKIVNSYSERELADILYKYGEERASRKIAKAIVNYRNSKPIITTTELAKIINDCIAHKTKINPATRSFQALRIEVNNELKALEKLLQNGPAKLSSGGRMAVISFHSLEDRMVKQAFKRLATPVRDDFGQIVSEAEYRIVTKKPIKGSEFDKTNPRARSAKLRVVEKIIKKQK
jgi:16S rRNA (cytosine1402-N4)-methyltransferase